jgi:hypothetical protein
MSRDNLWPGGGGAMEINITKLFVVACDEKPRYSHHSNLSSTYIQLQFGLACQEKLENGHTKAELILLLSIIRQLL